jgi:hypothetical protein
MSDSTLEAYLRPQVRCIPTVDRELSARAMEALERVGTVGLPDTVAVRLESALFPWYPDVKVVPIEPLATDHGEQAWYVYRDGRPV